MKVLEAAARRTILGVLLLLLKELKRLATAVETLTDSFRMVHGHRPMFHVEHGAQNSDARTGAENSESRTVPRYESDEPDWLRIDLLEALCREHHIAITEGMDLFQVGKEMGWLDASGQLVVLPTHYGE